MEVDLNTLEEGWTVKFRCGGEAVVGKKDGNVLFLGGYAHDLCFHEDGRYLTPGPCPFDIIEIIPKPFDWEDVKPGMAFKCRDNKSRRYCGPSLTIPGRYVILRDRPYGDYSPYLKKELTRAPEDDNDVIA